MNIVLGRKQVNIPNEPWQDVFDHIEDYVSRDECDHAAEAMLERIDAATRGKKAAFCWSGGKDSLVLADLCHQLGITKCALFLTQLEFPVFKAWLMEHKPAECEVLQLPFDLDWLAQHPEMLFPTGKQMQLWHKLVQRQTMIRYFNRDSLDVLLIGHRRIDGNTCGKDGFIRRKSGEVLFSPLYDWPHELIFAYIHYHGLEMPPIYQWHNGWRNGTHFWPTHKVSSEEQGWKEVYDIDPSVVIAAAEKFPGARRFLKGVGA